MSSISSSSSSSAYGNRRCSSSSSSSSSSNVDTDDENDVHVNNKKKKVDRQLTETTTLRQSYNNKQQQQQQLKNANNNTNNNNKNVVDVNDDIDDDDENDFVDSFDSTTCKNNNSNKTKHTTNKKQQMKVTTQQQPYHHHHHIQVEEEEEDNHSYLRNFLNRSLNYSSSNLYHSTNHHHHHIQHHHHHHHHQQQQQYQNSHHPTPTIPDTNTRTTSASIIHPRSRRFMGRSLFFSTATSSTTVTNSITNATRTAAAATTNTDTNNYYDHNQHYEKYQQDQKKRQLNHRRILVVLMFVFSGILIGFLTYVIIRKNVQSKSKIVYQQYGKILINQLQNEIHSTTSSIQSMSRTITINTINTIKKDTNTTSSSSSSTFPIGHVPGFESYASEIMMQQQHTTPVITRFTYTPLIPDHQIHQYLHYTSIHQLEWNLEAYQLYIRNHPHHHSYNHSHDPSSNIIDEEELIPPTQVPTMDNNTKLWNEFEKDMDYQREIGIPPPPTSVTKTIKIKKQHEQEQHEPKKNHHDRHLSTSNINMTTVWDTINKNDDNTTNSAKLIMYDPINESIIITNNPPPMINNNQEQHMYLPVMHTSPPPFVVAVVNTDNNNNVDLDVDMNADEDTSAFATMSIIIDDEINGTQMPTTIPPLPTTISNDSIIISSSSSTYDLASLPVYHTLMQTALTQQQQQQNQLPDVIFTSFGNEHDYDYMKLLSSTSSTGGIPPTSLLTTTDTNSVNENTTTSHPQHHPLHHPHTIAAYPVFRSLQQHQHQQTTTVVDHTNNTNHDNIMGILFAMIPWEHYFMRFRVAVVQQSQQTNQKRNHQNVTFHLILHNNCQQTLSYEIVIIGDANNKNHTTNTTTTTTTKSRPIHYTFLGMGDLHDERYNHEKLSVRLTGNNHNNSMYMQKDDIDQQEQNSSGTIPGHCVIYAALYPAYHLDDHRMNQQQMIYFPLLLSVLMGLIFLVILIEFMLYDKYVRNRNDKVQTFANQTYAMMDSLFPMTLANRLLEQHQQEEEVVSSQEILIMDCSTELDGNESHNNHKKRRTSMSHMDVVPFLFSKKTSHNDNSNNNSDNKNVSAHHPFLFPSFIMNHINNVFDKVKHPKRSLLFRQINKSNQTKETKRDTINNTTTNNKHKKSFTTPDHQHQPRTTTTLKRLQKTNTATTITTISEQHNNQSLTRLRQRRNSNTNTVGNNNSHTDITMTTRRRNSNKYHHHHGGGGSTDDFFYYKTKPIADLFTETTVIFADIVGFTAWSSVREPVHVFTLLESIYHTFDEMARKQSIYKVETIGDCYVAVCGLPDPRKDHAVNMARFARNCMFRMWSVTKSLERTLGPDTSDLTMRMGLHSGPVTGGVLRGEKARFQLFGETVNTASRMESTGMKGRIQLSQETADLILHAGKNAWITKRADKIHSKGKGALQTYWLELVDKSDVDSTVDCTESTTCDGDTVLIHETPAPRVSEKTNRLVEWVVEILQPLLKQIVLRRKLFGVVPRTRSVATAEFLYKMGNDQMVIDEVKEIITLPEYDHRDGSKSDDGMGIELDRIVIEQLESFVKEIASLYNNNPFHNFEHASHVTMSVVKLLSRIVAPSGADFAWTKGRMSCTLHDHTYGITSDPLTQFSCVLSALIHDLGHPGVPNAQLVKEKTEMALKYKNKSVAEQNSVDVAWGVLLKDKYKALRSAIYADEVELIRFRQLVVNSVMATDIVDAELKDLRNARWEKAFSNADKNNTMNDCDHDYEDTVVEDERDAINRKATIVIEHLIQASDVAHTMQHWHVYRKWNEMFFMECYSAYQTGRSEVDPSVRWYEGEIGFFDYYIIPLAKKLKNCGVFGVSSDEYLNYALQNRAEWEIRGKEVIAEMLAQVRTSNRNTVRQIHMNQPVKILRLNYPSKNDEDDDDTELDGDDQCTVKSCSSDLRRFL